MKYMFRSKTHPHKARSTHNNSTASGKRSLNIHDEVLQDKRLWLEQRRVQAQHNLARAIDAREQKAYMIELDSIAKETALLNQDSAESGAHPTLTRRRVPGRGPHIHPTSL